MIALSLGIFILRQNGAYCSGLKSVFFFPRLHAPEIVEFVIPGFCCFASKPPPTSSHPTQRLLNSRASMINGNHDDEPREAKIPPLEFHVESECLAGPSLCVGYVRAAVVAIKALFAPFWNIP